MSVKFRIGFEIEAEALFEIMAKFLPIDNLTVEEARAHPPAPRIAREPTIAAPVRRRGRAIKVTEGMGGVALAAMAHGPIRYRDIRVALKGAGYSGKGVGSLLARLIKHGLVVKVSAGVYARGKG